MKFTFISHVLSPALLGSLILTGCGGGGGSSSSSPNPTPVEPDTFLSSITPNGNATGVALGATVKAEFSKSLLASSINQQSLTLRLNDQLLTTNLTIDATGKAIEAESLTEMGLLCEYAATISGNVSDQEGNTLGNDFTWRFTTRDGQWQTAQTLDDQDNVFQTYLNQLDLYDNGEAFALWSNEVGVLQGNAYFKRYENGQWQENPQQINTPGTDLNGGEVASNSQGDIIIVWREQNNSEYQIYARYYDATNDQWSTVDQLPSSNNDVDSRFDVAISEDGIAYAAWSQEKTNGDFDLYVSKYLPGLGWQAPDIALTEAENDDYAPRIAIDQNNDLLLIWMNISPDDPTQADIYARRFLNETGDWQDVVAFDVDASNNVSHSLTMNANGQAIVTWNQVDDVQFSDSLYARYFNPDVAENSGWGTIQTVEKESGKPGRAFVTLDDDGNALLTWQQESDSNETASTELFANFYNVATSTWLTTPVELGTVTNIRDRYITNSYLSRNANGNAIATWSTPENDTYILHSKYFNATTKQWEQTQTIETTGYKLGTVKAVVDHQNHALAVWTQRVNDMDNVYASRFNVYTKAWTDSTLLSQSPPVIRDSAITVNNKGEGMLLWEQGSGSESTIMARSFR